MKFGLILVFLSAHLLIPTLGTPLENSTEMAEDKKDKDDEQVSIDESKEGFGQKIEEFDIAAKLENEKIRPKTLKKSRKPRSPKRAKILKHYTDTAKDLIEEVYY